jgi:mannosyl-3-phosphoglycerate synthase
MESDALGQFCHFTRGRTLAAHQKDPGLAQALAEAGYTDTLTEDRQMRDGKSEGMVIGMLLATATNMEYVGFDEETKEAILRGLILQ